MPYRRAISTLGCPEFSLEQTLALAKLHRLDAVELRALAGTIDLPSLFTTAYGSPANLAEQMKDSRIPIVSLDTSLKLAANTAADREDFLRFLPWAEALGVRWLRVFDGGHASDPDIYQAMAASVQWWRALKKEHDWKANIMVETHDALFTTPAISHFLALVPGTAILWDAQHTWKKGGEDPLATWRAIRPHVVHVHVKDSVNRPQGKYSYTYVLPGEGEFPMAPLRQALQDEFTGTVSLEWEKLWHPYLAPLDDALTTAAKNNWW
jgi:sugar phosphate isomerase/epimerase